MASKRVFKLFNQNSKSNGAKHVTCSPDIKKTFVVLKQIDHF